MLEWAGRCSPYPKMPLHRSTVWSALVMSPVQYVSNVALLQSAANY